MEDNEICDVTEETSECQIQPKLCACCGTRRIDLNSGIPGEYLCKECRADFIKLKVPGWLKACMAVFTALALVMCIYMAGRYNKNAVSKSVRNEGANLLQRAEDLYHAGKQYTALISLDEYLEANPKNGDVAFRATEMAMNCGEYDVAAYFINTFLLDVGITDDEYDVLSRYVDRINTYYDTADAIEEKVSSVNESYNEQMTEEEMDEYIQRMRDEVLSITLSPKYDKEYAYFYYGLYFAEDVEESMEYLEMTLNYLPVAAYSYARLAVYERSKGNFEKSSELIAKGKKIEGEVEELVRAEATLDLATGDYVKALISMVNLYNTNPEGLYVRDTYCVALYACGETAELEKTIADAESVDYEFDEDFYQLINGEMTVFDYYVDGEEY